jgi:hypothetical protein
MSTANTRELISKIATGSYSDEDLAAFLKAVKTMDKLTFLEAYQLLYQEINKYPAEALAPEFTHQLEKRLDLLEGGKDFLSGNLVSPASGRPIALFRGQWLNYAAAVLILMLGTGSYFLFFAKSRKGIAKIERQKERPKNDVAPGGNKAILTLGNGEKIILDSAKNGALASQGNTRILKLANGQLSYNSLNDSSDRPGMPTQIIYNTLTTPRGGQYQLVLPDGSKVWLDASSSIIYPTDFAGTERKVKMTGQAYFEVAKNEKLPFIVQRGEMSIQVLGTHFNVNAYEDDSTVNTTLLEGTVRVSKGAVRTILAPGQQIQITKNGDFKLVRNADTEEAIAWKNGFFSFKRSDLKTVMRQLSRWYDVEVIYEGNIPPQKFGGKMGRDLNLSEILEGLEKSLVHFRIEGKKLIVMP